ncbi:uncharacterized protein LOC124136849 [Haliotis rufescens]|uniref:uncharacterized protein LOC124136849 n=1 Tax=Haliotis rufescens TaxID=6454 RepID=UPI00201EE2EC|nr:uncharacterized protein LOC124136849 [Haliotis rufescens]
MRTASDEIVYASCCVNAVRETISTHAIEANPATKFLNTQTETTDFFGVRLNLLKSNGLPLEEPVPMNQVYSLCVAVTDEAYDFVGLFLITARNEDSSRSVQTYSDGCNDVGADSIIHRMPYRVNAKKICMEYKPGFFTPGPPEIIFDIEYNLCTTASQSSCNLETECNDAGRKRRQAIEEPNKNNAVARVRFEGGQTASESQGAEAVAPSVAECNTTPTMFVAIIATSVIVVLLLLVTIVLSCLLMKRRRRKEFDGDGFKTEKSSHKPQY